MNSHRLADGPPRLGLVPANGETPVFEPGNWAKVKQRFPIGHCRVSLYPGHRFRLPSVQKGVLTSTGLADKMKEIETRWAAGRLPVDAAT